MEMFRHARRIGGGKELALLLIGIAPALPADGQVHTEYLALSRRLRDDADRRHALVALIACRRLAVAMQVRVLGEAAALGSEMETELLLTQIAGNLSRDLRVEQAFRAAAGRIGSVPGRARVMAAWSGAAAPAPAPSPADTVPEENLQDTEGTTVLMHERPCDGRRSDVVLLAKDVLLTADRRDFDRISAGRLRGLPRERLTGVHAAASRIQPGSDGRLRYTWNGDFSGDRPRRLAAAHVHPLRRFHPPQPPLVAPD